MRVLFLTQVFPPEIHPTAVMVQQLAQHLVSRGHEVAVATGFPHHPHGRVLGGYRKSPLLVENVGGVKVLRGWHATTTRRGIGSRAAVMVSQTVGTGAAALFARGCDVVVSYGPPLMGPLMSAVVAAMNRARLLTVIYDIYPDVAVESGQLQNPVAVSLAKVAERSAYRHSDRILVLSEGFKRTLMAKGVPADRICVIPVWLEPDEITPRSRDNEWRKRQGIGLDRFVVLYAGTVGLVAGAEVMLEVAERFRGDSEVLFLFVGEGQMQETLQSRARERGLSNVWFRPFQPRADLPDVQATADVSVVTLAQGRGRTSVPSKVTAYMAAARPVIASVDEDSDTAECIQSAGCGVVVPPGDASAIAEAITRLRSGAGIRDSMGRAGRAAFEQKFASPAVLDRYTQILSELADAK